MLGNDEPALETLDDEDFDYPEVIVKWLSSDEEASDAEW